METLDNAARRSFTLPLLQRAETVDRIDRIVEFLRGARSVQVIGHLHPDGDCIGSVMALHHILQGWEVRHALAIEGPLPRTFAGLPDLELIQGHPDPELNPELAVYLDCATLERSLKAWRPTCPIINIDHHAGNTAYGRLNWIQPECAATGEMLYYLALRARVELTEPMADALLLALTTDTGAYRYSNAGWPQHVIAADLVRSGGSVDRVMRIAYANQPLESLQLTGYVLGQLRVVAGGQLAWSQVRAETLRRHGGDDNLPEDLASQLRMIQGVRVSALFRETEAGGLRLNLRSDGSYDVSRLARRWGGGGHPGAAGLHLAAGDFEAQRDQILEDLLGLLQQGDPD